MAQPVLLISSDPFLGASLEAVARGRVQVARLDLSRRPAAWPAEPTDTVVLDVTARQRDAANAWVRRHHPGPLVVLLKPGERNPALPPDPARLVIGRPFRLADLVAILEHPPAPPAADPPAAGPGPAPVVAVTPKPGRGSGDLLQASAEQRMRRLGSLSGATPAARPLAEPAPEPPPSPAEPPPRPQWPTAATRLDVRRPRPARRRRRLAARVLVGALVLLALAAAWLAFGLLEAHRDLLVGAGAVRSELAAAEAALAGGRPDEAGTAVRAARSSLEAAAAVPDRRELRVAARLPVLSGGVADTRRLLAAAAGLTAAGDRAVAVATHLGSGRPALLRGGRFDLDALDDATGQARGLVAELERARGQLQQVRGGPFAPGVDQQRRWALGRVEEATARARPLVATLDALPAALGAAGPRGYLVVLTSPAELRPSGGVPLAVREVVLDRGVVRARPGGGELATALRDAGASAHFPTTGRALLRATGARGRPAPDGVIALDPLAMRALLEATGPVAVPGYGRLDAAGAVGQLTRGADARWPGQAERRRYHQAVLAAVVARFLNGRDLVATGRVLAAAGAGRNVQVYAADPAVARMLGRHRLDGALADPGGGDYLAVHTSNRNRSRVDAFQRRSIRQVVRLAPDGSARVTRTIRVVNAVPAGQPVRAELAGGEGSGRAAGVLATSLPPGAVLASATFDGRPVRPATAREQGRPVLRVDLDLRPGQAATLTVGYRLRRAAAGDGLRYRLTAEPQVLLDPAVLRVEVTAPPGGGIVPAPGWTVTDGTATLVRRLTTTTTAALDLHG